MAVFVSVFRHRGPARPGHGSDIPHRYQRLLVTQSKPGSHSKSTAMGVQCLAINASTGRNGDQDEGAAGRLVSGRKRTLHEAEYSGIKALPPWTKVPGRPERIRGMLEMPLMAV